MYLQQSAIRVRLCSAIILLPLLLLASRGWAAPFDCGHHHCGLLTHDNNPLLVVGKVEAVATPSQMRQVLRWAHAHGYWANLPANGHGYLDFVRLVSLSVPASPRVRSVSVLMSREEYDASPFKAGALVRYSPHDAAHDAITYQDPATQAYWELVGCVAQLCAAGDQHCISRYRQGVFSRQTGRQLQVGTHKRKPGGTTINPHTMLPEAGWGKHGTH